MTFTRSQSHKRVLVTGATGYVGGRLVPRLLLAGHRVRALARSAAKVESRPWAKHPMVEIKEGDVLDPASLRRALKDCWAAYYLVHSMNPATKDFARTDRQAARNMVQAADAAELDRIVYLGGLIPPGQKMSHHLESRAEVGRILQSGSVPTTVLRAAMILGSGSASFEILRYLVERLPVMITPKWVRSRVQPICIRNVLNYLEQCLEHDEVKGQIYDICGPDTLTYEELFQIYAQEAGLPKRLILPVPVLSPKLSSYWIHLVTPIHSSLAQPLAEGLSNTMVCGDNRIRKIMPQDLLDCRRTIRRVLEKRQQQIVETCWTDAGPLLPPEWVQHGDVNYAGGTVIHKAYRMVLKASPQEAWEPVVRIGGETGWYFANFLWRLRGWLDKLFGGISLARGRRHPRDLAVGDALDFWRVLEIREPKRLILVGDLKAPGDAVMDFRVIPLSANLTELQMIGRFLPKGLWGLLYWYVLYPFHAWIYHGVLKNLAKHGGLTIVRGPEAFKPASFDGCK